MCVCEYICLFICVLTSQGAKTGKNYSLNFPLLAGMDDAAYSSIFIPVVDKVI